MVNLTAIAITPNSGASRVSPAAAATWSDTLFMTCLYAGDRIDAGGGPAASTTAADPGECRTRTGRWPRGGQGPPDGGPGIRAARSRPGRVNPDGGVPAAVADNAVPADPRRVHSTGRRPPSAEANSASPDSGRCGARIRASPGSRLAARRRLWGRRSRGGSLGADGPGWRRPGRGLGSRAPVGYPLNNRCSLHCGLKAPRAGGRNPV